MQCNDQQLLLHDKKKLGISQSYLQGGFSSFFFLVCFSQLENLPFLKASVMHLVDSFHLKSRNKVQQVQVQNGQH